MSIELKMMKQEAAVEIEPLPAAENKRRAELENIIERNFKAFVETGKALAEIRESRLYRSTHTTFEGYCKDLWEMCDRRARQLMGASGVIINLQKWNHGSGNQDENLGTMVPILPLNERQARPLARLEPDQQQEVWKYIVSETRRVDKKITAAFVERAVRLYVGEVIEQRIGETKQRIALEEKFSEEFKTCFGALLEEVDRARHEGWKKTSREAALKFVDELRDVILKGA